MSSIIAGLSFVLTVSSCGSASTESTIVTPEDRKGSSNKTDTSKDSNIPDPASKVDTDGDGIPDVRDACPDKPEDRDGFDDSDGCPDLDNDGDGIPDTDDACPNTKGEKNNDKRRNGCPVMRMPGQQIRVS